MSLNQLINPVESLEIKLSSLSTDSTLVKSSFPAGLTSGDIDVTGELKTDTLEVSDKTITKVIENNYQVFKNKLLTSAGASDINLTVSQFISGHIFYGPNSTGRLVAPADALVDSELKISNDGDVFSCSIVNANFTDVIFFEDSNGSAQIVQSAVSLGVNRTTVFY